MPQEFPGPVFINCLVFPVNYRTSPLHTAPPCHSLLKGLEPSITVHHSQDFPSSFAYAHHVMALGLSWSFYLLLLIPHAVCIGVETFQTCSTVSLMSWSRLKDHAGILSVEHWHAIPWLIISKPDVIPFSLQIYFKAFSLSPSNFWAKNQFSPLWKRKMASLLYVHYW